MLPGCCVDTSGNWNNQLFEFKTLPETHRSGGVEANLLGAERSQRYRVGTRAVDSTLCIAGKAQWRLARLPAGKGHSADHIPFLIDDFHNTSRCSPLITYCTALAVSALPWRLSPGSKVSSSLSM